MCCASLSFPPSQLSPIESEDFLSWIEQAKTGRFFREERDHEIRLAEACAQGFASNRSKISKEEDQEPVLHRDLLIALDGLVVKIKQNAEMQNLFLQPQQGPSDGRMTISQVQRNLEQRLYDHDLNLQYAVPWATFVAPVKRLLTDMAQVWIDFEAAPGASKDDLDICETVKRHWYSQIAKAGGLLRHLDELFKSQQRGDRRLRCLPGPTAAAAAPAVPSGASDEDDEAQDEPEADSSAAAMDQSSDDDDNEAAAAAPSSTGAADAAAVPMGALEVIAPTDKIIADFHRAFQRALKPLDRMRGIIEAERAAATQQKESLERQVELLRRQVAAAPERSQLDEAVAQRDGALAELANLRTRESVDLANARSANAALQRQVNTETNKLRAEADEAAKLRKQLGDLQKELDRFYELGRSLASLTTPNKDKRAREPDNDDDEDEQQTRSRPRHAPDSV